MKILKITFLTLLVGLMTSCRSDNGGGSDDTPEDLEVQTYTNLYAAPEGAGYNINDGEFIKFDISAGAITTSDDWDIAFRATTILVNGGESTGLGSEPARNGDGAAYIADGTFNDITTVNTSSFRQDGQDGLAIPTGSGNGWYIYEMSTHTIFPKAGKILVFKTKEGNYAKMEILSYYKDSDTSTPLVLETTRYYTFNYVYQPNGSTTF